MERSISLESWEEVQRHGQGIADRLNSLAQGIGCMFQSHIRTSTGVCVPQQQQSGHHHRSSNTQAWGLKINLPWPFASQQQPSALERDSFEIHKPRPVVLTSRKVSGAPEISTAFYDLGHRLGQAGADFGACVGGFVGNVMSQFQKAPPMSVASSRSVSASSDEDSLEWKDKDEGGGGDFLLNSWQSPSTSKQRRADETSAALPAETLSSSSSSSSSSATSSSSYEASSDELVAAIAKSSNQFLKQSSITITTTFDSRTQDIESSVVARGDLWRAEASHGGTSSTNGSSPLFLLQIGPILFVRDTTLLLPIHLSKRHLLWYGFDRKNGLHSLCPAIWSKHRRWLLMSMVCLNPLACSFMDLQFPNGQMTYVAGEGVSGSAFLPCHGGLLQVQGRHPGESKLSFSFKSQCGTRVCPSLHLPEKSVSVGVTQPLAWQRSGVMLRPTIQLSVTPTFGGRNAGWRAEVVHSPKEKLSVACGCSLSLEPTAFASISVGRSKRNGEHTGNSGLVLQVETPLENLRRASFSVQLNSGVEF